MGLGIVDRAFRLVAGGITLTGLGLLHWFPKGHVSFRSVPTLQSISLFRCVPMLLDLFRLLLVDMRKRSFRTSICSQELIELCVNRPGYRGVRRAG